MTSRRTSTSTRLRGRPGSAPKKTDVAKLKQDLKKHKKLCDAQSKTIGSQEEEIVALKNRIELLETEFTQSENKNKILNEDQSNLRMKLKELETDNKELHGHCNGLLEKLEIAHDQIEHLKNTKEEEVRQALELRNGLANRNKEFTDLKKLQDETNARLQLTKEHLVSANSFLDESQARERLQKSQVLQYEATLNEAQLKLSENIDQLKQVKEQTQEQVVMLHASHQEEMKRQKLKLKKLRFVLDEKDIHISRLQEKLGEKLSKIEALDESIKGSVQLLLDNLAGSAVMQGNGEDSIRWKIIRKQVEVLRNDVRLVFKTMSAQAFERETVITNLQRQLDNIMETHQVELDKEKQKVERSEMYMRLLQPLPYITENKISDERKETMPVQMRGRLLVSSTRVEGVSKIIERVRNWENGYSLILMSCCKYCGCFFIEKDETWPCDCPYHHEHEEFIDTPI